MVLRDVQLFGEDLRPIENISFDNGHLPEYITSINAPLSASAEMTMECEINAPLFHRLCGFDPSCGPDITGYTLIGKAPYMEQIRKHKKKRINKKWAKRYGYRTKFKDIKIEGVHFNETGCGEFEFTGVLGG